jgi:uncharacterized membrane protein (DUF373 family)
MIHDNPSLEKIVLSISWIPVGLYLGIALILAIVGILSLYQAGTVTYQMVSSGHFNEGGAQLVFVAVFQAITAIVLFETTVVFLKTEHLAVQTLLIAGLTETIRHILVFDIGTMEPLHLFSLVAIMGVLIAGIVLLRGDDYLIGTNGLWSQRGSSESKNEPSAT